eukprot:3114864-Pyramimonas_sp.AAC.1
MGMKKRGVGMRRERRRRMRRMREEEEDEDEDEDDDEEEEETDGDANQAPTTGSSTQRSGTMSTPPTASSHAATRFSWGASVPTRAS